MNKYNADNITDLTNQLSLNDVELILRVFSDRISIFNHDTRKSSASVSIYDGNEFNTCFNGPSIQINAPSSETWED